MNLAPVIARLWDYGWLCRDCVKLPEAQSDQALIQSYIASLSFHTSFLPSEKDGTGIHGPFVAAHLCSSDYVPSDERSLDAYLEQLRLSEEFTSPPSTDQWSATIQFLHDPFKTGCRCYVLKYDETHSELFHDWGFVFTVFREFLFIGAHLNSIERFVIGYD